MQKALCFGALGVAALMALIFLLNLVVGRPFGGGASGFATPFVTIDLVGLIASAIVLYLAVNATRDLK